MAAVGVEVKSKVPKHPLHGTLFHVGENGELLREDPRQLKMKGLEKPPLKTVAFKPPAEASVSMNIEVDDDGEEV